MAAFISINAQGNTGRISGVVIDEQTKLPIENVNIYIANSLVGTSTDKNGEFQFPDLTPGRYTIIFSHLTYMNKTEKVDFFKDKKVNMSISLAPKPIEFPEIAVKDKYDDDWWEMFDTFKDELLGSTWFADGCEILDPYHINLFESDEGVLFAESEKPIQVENRSLGYNVTFFLKHFEYKVGMIKYAGIPYFEEMYSENPEDSLAWRENRLEAYMGSLRHFLRALSECYDLVTKEDSTFKTVSANDNLNGGMDDDGRIQDKFFAKQGFSVYLNKLYSNALGKKYVSSIFNIESVIDSARNPNELVFVCNDKIEIQYFKEYNDFDYSPQISYIQLYGNSVYFDKLGRYYDEYKIETMGYLYKQRLAEMLPFEYEPSDSVLFNTDFR